MPMPMARRAGVPRSIWGYFMRSERDHDSDSEDCVSDNDQALDLGDIVDASADGTIAKPRTNQWKTAPFHLYDTKETVRVRGRFIVSDPWWAARMTVVKNRNDLWELSGSITYSLRKDQRVVSENVVPLFLTSCDVHPEHLQMFTQAIRSIGKTNELTFENVPDLLGEFAAMSDDNRSAADQIQRHITAKGALVTNYYGLELFYELMSKLLPKKFVSFVENKRYSGETLERLQEALKDDLWVFGYGNVLATRYKVFSCEATLAAYTSSGLVEKLTPVERDALVIYDTLKACCRSKGHTFVPDMTLRHNHRPACSHPFEDWDAAIAFLGQHKVIMVEQGQGHQRVYLYKLWNAEQSIARGIRKLFEDHSDSPWDLEVKLDSSQFKDIQEDADQMKAAEKILSKPVVVISGAGGCGKTHVVSKIFHHIQHERNVEEESDKTDANDVSTRHLTPDTDTHTVTQDASPTQTPDPSSTLLADDLPRILMTAPTGKVANLLGQRSNVPGYTLHQVMFSYSYYKRKQKAEVEKWKFSDVEILIADECSLISVETFSSVLRVLLEFAKLRKLVLLGDIKQLPSIQPGNFLADMYAALWTVDSSIMLSTNHRSESQLIVDNASRISQGQRPQIDDTQRFCQTTIDENTDGSTEYPECDRDTAIRKLLQEQTDLHCHETSQFISFRRRDCDAINELCCKHYNKHSMFEQQCRRRRRLFRVGDKVCCTKNNYVKDHLNPEKDRRLCNGEIFFIRRDRTIYVDGDKKKTQRLLVLDDLRSKCEVDMRDLNHCGLRHSWARTIHTFQGSEVNTLVYVVGPVSCQTWQHVYTAVTRGRNRVTLVTRQSDLHTAISRQPQRRNTGLREKMTQQLKDMVVAAKAVPSGTTMNVTSGSSMSTRRELFTSPTTPSHHSNGSATNDVPSCTAPTEKNNGQLPTSPFSDWGDADSQDIAALEEADDPTSETAGKVARTPTKRRISEKEPVTDSSVSPLKRSLAQLNF